ncbi:MAG: outer membrane protein assembly factor BamB family protein [Planctomycetota bacterium]
MKRVFWWCVIVGAVFSRAAAQGTDWPQWRCDAGRTAASEVSLPAEISLEWVRQYTKRVPVWKDPLNRDLMRYDTVFEPVVAGGRMFLGFNDSDKVVALDTRTGRELWTFRTDGPVRLPCAVWEGKVYFTSDDGYLYCVGAAEGDLLWKFRGGPSDGKIIGNSRLISMWPARGGPVVKDGTVYFAASIWPMMGTFVYALDAETGKIAWENSSTGADYINQPHNSPAFAGVAPQGSLVVAGERLLVPGGRSVPACFDRATGRLLYYEFAANNKTGGAFVAARGGVFFNHHREKVTSIYGLDDGKALLRSLGKNPVLTETVTYVCRDNITAIHTEGLLAEPDKWNRHVLWDLPVDGSGDLIKAGQRLYAAGGNVITAVDIPGEGGRGEIAWRIAVDGKVERLLAADGRLFAVTLDGRVMAFADRKAEPRYISSHHWSGASSAKEREKARRILEDTGVAEGYALYYGGGEQETLEALLKESQLHIVAVVPGANRVRALRRAFERAGFAGERISFLEGGFASVLTPPFMASLMILDGVEIPPATDAERFKHLLDSMRPYGGKAWVRAGGDEGGGLSKFLNAARRAGMRVRSGGGVTIVSRDGALPGAAEWTHNYGNIANAVKSDDALVRLPLGVLWFGGSSNVDVLPRHGHGPPEQVVGGRLFIMGMECLSARDVFTGRVLWKTALPDLGNYGVYYDESYKNMPTNTRYNQEHIPGANVRGTNFVATMDRVYVIEGHRCRVLDAATGESLESLSLPPLDPEAERKKYPEWGYLGVHEDIILAGYGFVAFSDLVGARKAEYSVKTDYDKSASGGLVAMDRRSGEVLWRIDAEHGFIHNAIAVGGGAVYCLDKLPVYVEKLLKRRGVNAGERGRLAAFDVATGEPLWETREGVFGTFLCYCKEQGILLQATRPSRDMVAGENGERMIAYRASDGEVLWDKEVEYSTFPIPHGEIIVTEGTMLSLLTGEVLKRRNPLTGVQEPWVWTRKYGCNYPTASEHLLLFRSAAAGFYDLAGRGGTGNFGGFKSGCTANLVAADGVLNAPDYTRTCSCSYQNQTSLALVHMPEVEVWTFNDLEAGDGPLRRVGLNFGAPGDRMDDAGTLWLDFPSVGGPSPEIEIEVAGEKLEWFRHHSSRIVGGGHEWISASGAHGVESVEITLSKEEETERAYTVRLYFAEPEETAQGERSFDVLLDGERVLENFDVVREAGGARRTIVREFDGVMVRDRLVITFQRAENSTKGPLICGLEVAAREW